MASNNSGNDDGEDMDVKELKERYREIEGFLYGVGDDDLGQRNPSNRRLMEEQDRIEDQLRSELSAEEIQELKMSNESVDSDSFEEDDGSSLEQEVSNWDRDDLEYGYIQQRKRNRNLREMTSVGRLENVVDELDEFGMLHKHGGTGTNEMYHSIARQLHLESKLLLADLRKRRTGQIDWDDEFPDDLKDIHERDIDFAEYSEIVDSWD